MAFGLYQHFVLAHVLSTKENNAEILEHAKCWLLSMLLVQHEQNDSTLE